MSVFSAMGVSASGLRAERMRMDVITTNIANVETTRSPAGGPYRRQQVILGASQTTGNAAMPGATGYQGVRVLGIEQSTDPLPRIYDPTHPDADEQGYVLMPNVELPTEMADMIIAARAYEANAAAFRSARDLIRQALSILA